MDTHLNLPEIPAHPMDLRLSFKPFIKYLTQRKATIPAGDVQSQVVDYLLEQLNPLIPADSIEETYTPDQLEAIAQLLKLSVLPIVGTEREIPYAFGLPIPLELFHASDTFIQYITPALEMGNEEHKNPTDKLRYFYQLILENCYTIRFIKELTPSISFQKTERGITKYYRLKVNVNFVEPQYYQSELPPLQNEWVEFAKGYRSFEQMTSTLPLHLFTLSGFCVFLVEDITEESSLQQLKEVFIHLQTDSEELIYNRFEKALRDLCGLPDIHIGLMPFFKVNDTYVFHPQFSNRSVFFTQIRTCEQHGDLLQQPDIQKTIAQRLKQHDHPHLFCDLNQFAEPELRLLHNNGLKSFMLYPIKAGDELIGVIEMASENADSLGEEVLFKVEKVVPLVRELLLFQINEFNKNVDRLIRQRFTSLQPAVEWKFNEVAWQYLKAGNRKPTQPELARVRFPQVYPLYGAVDIRNSSSERHRAVRHDLSQQLSGVEQLLEKVREREYRHEALLEWNKHYQNVLLLDLSPDDEESITLFLIQQVSPYLRHLQQSQKELQEPIESYFRQTDPQSGIFHRAQRDYEQSLDWINSTVNSYIEQEEQKLQSVYPHYFEKYRTDGMEYNIYVGQSIAPKTPFVADDLRRLRLWQLTSMIEMAQLTHRLLPHLPLPLQTTQLILAHAQPVAISFREDEHRFDVEGSYSIRYEVIKKRIDKAVVLGSGERLTQPDQIALVYMNQQEISDFLPLIHQLQEKNQIAAEIEYLELEPVQGLVGLKAIRLRIQYTNSAPVQDLQLEQVRL
ncbi:hypothetical protein [Siphonobacter sp. SORGH_AS_1065]|uniref:hypothetical protein n=1 Tax=Siphonobacter sp. SORGH_AS_1065 TaxID=3041795 RepID=UPI00277F856F|nr:hypothetical protein [Siphonobacter sp. SORGH_AS_1065]MDQ1090349.1 hypothetical protein [Siphonobacter sp. SORGH_AS_1065]